jgi:hypothetical protein
MGQIDRGHPTAAYFRVDVIGTDGFRHCHGPSESSLKKCYKGLMRSSRKMPGVSSMISFKLAHIPDGDSAIT